MFAQIQEIALSENHSSFSRSFSAIRFDAIPTDSYITNRQENSQ